MSNERTDTDAWQVINHGEQGWEVIGPCYEPRGYLESEGEARTIANSPVMLKLLKQIALDYSGALGRPPWLKDVLSVIDQVEHLEKTARDGG